jgi:hypothetical protein
MDQVPTDIIVAEESVRAGVAALERIHGRHLADMSEAEQADARAHWREQVEEVLGAVRDAHTRPLSGDRGRAVITFTDAGEEIDVNVAFEPDLRELPNGDVEGTPAQILAVSALEAITSAEEDGELEP